MKTALIIYFISINILTSLFASEVYAQKLDTPISIQFKKTQSLANALEQLRSETKIKFTYDPALAGNVQVGTGNYNEEKLGSILNKILENSNITFKEQAGTIILYKKENTLFKSQPQQPGRISGKLLDEQGKPMLGASVRIVQHNGGTQSDIDGNYALSLSPGSYTVEVSYLGYKTQQVTGVKVIGGKNTMLDIVLQQSGTSLGEVVITASYGNASAKGLYARQKANTAMTDGISAEQIGKTGDNNTTQVLRRVAGVNIDDGKYAVIRGMSERYNNVQLNGASLPSTEPNRRNFAFDVIPSGLVDNVTVYKTFTPDLTGEFTGGLVEVNTLAVPEKKMLNLSVGSGINTISTGKDFYSNTRYSGDWLFGETDKRKWYTGRTADQSQQNIVNAGNSNTYGLGKYTAQPLQNYSLTAGIPFELGQAGKLGVVASLTYRHEENKDEIIEAHMINRDSIYRPSFGNGSYRYRAVTTTGAVANVGWENNENKITLRNLFNSRFSHTNQERYTWESYGTYQNRNTMYEQYSVPLNSQLWQTQLQGEHKLFGDRLNLSWNGSLNGVTRTNPDDRFAMGVVMGESPEGKQFVD